MPRKKHLPPFFNHLNLYKLQDLHRCRAVAFRMMAWWYWALCVGCTVVKLYTQLDIRPKNIQEQAAEGRNCKERHMNALVISIFIVSPLCLRMDCCVIFFMFYIMRQHGDKFFCGKAASKIYVKTSQAHCFVSLWCYLVIIIPHTSSNICDPH